MGLIRFVYNAIFLSTAVVLLIVLSPLWIGGGSIYVLGLIIQDGDFKRTFVDSWLFFSR